MKELLKKLFWNLVSVVIYCIPMSLMWVTDYPKRNPIDYTNWQLFTLYTILAVTFGSWLYVSCKISTYIRKYFEK